MAKKDSFSPPALGGSSLLVVFAVLALTVFALLSLSTVRADIRLGDAAAQAVADYYAADCQAQEILARLRTGESAPDGVELTATIVDYADHSEVIYKYAVSISDAQELRVEVLIDGADHQILRWEAVRAVEWEPSYGPGVWDGNTI